MASAKQETAVQLAKVNPAYLHSNSTCHTWPFSAFAELIDNAYDPDVDAKEMWIDVKTIDGNESLIFTDNGNGMNPDKLHKMLSFGFSEKEAIGQFKPVGRYGNGFKSGSMRLGDDALVITRCLQYASVGFLSQTYLRDIGAETVMIPMVTWKIFNGSERVMKATPENRDSLKAILKHSLLKTPDEIERELDSLPACGTKIIIYNLKRDRPNSFELDFESDPTDIRYPETATLDTSTPDRPVAVPKPEYRKSLRKYCTILYKKPKLKIYLRDKKVENTLIEWSLKRALVDIYKPKDSTKRTGIRLTFGYTKDKDPEACGLMLYHNNRLIKAYEKVGCQLKQTNHESIGVQGIAELNLLEPNNTKQDFIRDGKYAHFIAQAARKLNEYVIEKKHRKSTSTSESDEDGWRWVKCDKCESFRRLPRDFKDELPDEWFCFMNPDNMYNRCEIPEERLLKDEEEVKPYEKTFRKLQAEKKRKEKLKQTDKEPSSTVQRQESVADDDSQDIYIVDEQRPVILNAVDQLGLGGAESTPVTEGMLRLSTTVADVQGRVTPQQKTERKQCDTVQRQESVADDDSQFIYIVDEQRPVILEAQDGSGEDDGSETAFSSAMVSDKNDSQPSWRRCEIPEEPHLNDEDITPYENFKTLQTEEKRKEKRKKKADREQSNTVQRQESLADDDTHESFVAQDHYLGIQEAHCGSGEDQDLEVDGFETALSSAVVSDENDSQPSGRIQRFAEKRKSEDSEGSRTPAKVPNVVSTSAISSVGVSVDGSRETTRYLRKDMSPIREKSQSSGGHIDEAGDRRLDNHVEKFSSSELAAVNSLKQELIICQKRLEEKDQALKRMEEEKLRKEEELKKKKTELLNLWVSKKTDQKELNKLKKEKEEVDKKINNFQRQCDDIEEKLLSEKRQLMDEIEGHKADKASLQQELMKWKDEATKYEKELERVTQSEQECSRISKELEEYRSRERDLKITMLRFMQLMIPDYEYGPPDEIGNVIQEFIEANENGSEQS